MKTLDRSKPFGQVFGTASHSFEQDGCLFDHEGKEVGGKAKALPAGTGDANKLATSTDTPKVTHMVGARAVVLADLDADQLRAIAAEAEVKVHPNAGEKKLREALAQALPAGTVDQLDAQLQG